MASAPEALFTSLLGAPGLLHWRAGWALILGGFLSGALLGLGFHREGFLGGYGSLPRRLLRLGHVALVALGVLHLVVGAAPDGLGSPLGSALLLAGSITMPANCFLAAWRPAFRHGFFAPVLLLAGAAASFLLGATA